MLNDRKTRGAANFSRKDFYPCSLLKTIYLGSLNEMSSQVQIKLQKMDSNPESRLASKGMINHQAGRIPEVSRCKWD